MSVQITRYSRWMFGELLTDEGVEFFDLLKLPPLEAQVDDLQHVVGARDRLDTLSMTYYRVSSLQWVIAHANDIDLWPLGVYPGQVLRIPSPRYVLQVWLAQARPRTQGA